LGIGGPHKTNGGGEEGKEERVRQTEEVVKEGREGHQEGEEEGAEEEEENYGDHNEARSETD